MDVVSLFAGCGGLDLGFKRAGFNIIWANEFDKSIHDTYRLNHPTTILNTSDIRLLTGDDIPNCDGIIGGPPCQAWSEGGKRLGIEDPRGQLFVDYIRIVKDKQPKFFVIENVQGILEDKHKKSLDWFMSLLKEAGYKIKYELLNAADYKIPQDRFRVFFIGIRNDIKVDFHFPDAISDTPITLRQAIGDITEEPRNFNNDIVKEVNPLRPNHDTYTGDYDRKYMSRNRVRSWDETSFTMQAQARNAPQHPKAPKMTFISVDKRVFANGYEHLYRRLSVRECARIQTFPDRFIFLYNDIKDGYKMVGNAVPPRLAWFLALQMKQAFSKEVRNEDVLQTYSNTNKKGIFVARFAELYPDIIIKNCYNSNEKSKNLDKRVLVCLVSQNNMNSFLNRTAQLYYTGRKFPENVNIEKLFYFVPYIKGKGIKDLYIIKIARVGSKHEIVPSSTQDDLRLIFEIEYVEQLFDSYIPIHLNIWHTFSDMTLESLIRLNELKDE